MRRGRFGRRRTFGKSMTLVVIGAVAMIALIVKRRGTDELIEQAQERVPEEAAEVLAQDAEEAEESPREEIRSIIRESVRRSRGEA